VKGKLERGANSSYWPAKIARNRERDGENTARVIADGWRVLRLWETDAKRDTEAAVRIVAEAVRTAGQAMADREPT
jgi:DNA mismatch endonuclease, patch repair protein